MVDENDREINPGITPQEMYEISMPSSAMFKNIAIADIGQHQERRNSENKTEKEIPVSNDGDPEKGWERLRGDLNHLRAHCQDFRLSTSKLKNIFSERTITPGECEKIKEFPEFLHVYSTNKAVILKTIGKMEKQLDQNSYLADLCADQIADIQCCWSRVEYCMDNFQEQSPDRMKESLKEIDEKLCNLIVLCGQVTIPGRLNLHLKNMRIGQPLNFYDTFKDEICSESDSRFILNYLSKQPNVFNGLFDVENGIVYKASSNKTRQKWTYIGAVALILCGAVATFFGVPYLTQFFPELQKAGVSNSQYLVAYLFVMLGGCVHVLIDIIKEKQSAASKSRISLTDWYLWGHINEFSIYIGIVMLWIGAAGLVWINQLDVISAFAVGYSIDSIYDVFVARFDTGVTSRSGEIIKVIKG